MRKLLLGENGVVRTWLRAGARGWRLDVAEELSDELIADIKAAVVEERPDGPSNKLAYGKLRKYLLGDELDSAMNYPLRDAILGILVYGENAYQCSERIETLRDNYPPVALACCRNLLGSHDKPRIAAVLGGGPDESQLPEEERGRFRLDENSMGLAKGRFWLATRMQMTLPGVPSIYYGDEYAQHSIGLAKGRFWLAPLMQMTLPGVPSISHGDEYALEGHSDPGNRRTLPTPDAEHDRDMLNMVRNSAMLRRALPFLIVGTLDAFAYNDDVLCYRRRGSDGQVASVLINHSLSDARSVRVPIEGDFALDLVSGTDLKRGADGCAEVRLWPLGSAVVYSSKEQRATAVADRMARSQASSSITVCPMRAPCAFPSRGILPSISSRAPISSEVPMAVRRFVYGHSDQP